MTGLPLLDPPDLNSRRQRVTAGPGASPSPHQGPSAPAAHWRAPLTRRREFARVPGRESGRGAPGSGRVEMGGGSGNVAAGQGILQVLQQPHDLGLGERVAGLGRRMR